MVRWKIWQKVFPTFFVWLLEGVPFIVVFGFSEKVFKYLSSLFCWDLSGLPLSLCPTFMYLVPQKVLFWLSSVCWVRKLNTLKWDILATDVAVYFDSKLRKLKLQTWNRSTGPAKVREKPPNNAENRGKWGVEGEKIAENAAQMRRWTTFSDIYIPDERNSRNQLLGLVMSQAT